MAVAYALRMVVSLAVLGGSHFVFPGLGVDALHHDRLFFRPRCVDIIGHARIKYVGKSQPSMVYSCGSRFHRQRARGQPQLQTPANDLRRLRPRCVWI
eukprot:COSAG05_NODE_2048_length_3640_cov_5.415619_7_plen_98_part_00